MIIKMADNFVLFKGTDNIFLNFIWQIMNSIYPLEGIFFLMIFIHNFLPFFEKKLSPKFI